MNNLSNLSNNQENFDKYAQTWDTGFRINRARIIAYEIIKSLDGKREYSALEFGCGTGLVSFNLYNQLKNITLVDSSEGMIEILNSKIDKYQAFNMKAKHMDISGDNLLNEKYDLIYNSMVLHHIQDIPLICKHFYSLLKNNSNLCIVDLNEEDGSFHKKYPDFNGHNGFDQEKLKLVLENTGFKDIESNTFYYGKKDISGETIEYSLFLMKGYKE